MYETALLYLAIGATALFFLKTLASFVGFELHLDAAPEVDSDHSFMVFSINVLLAALSAGLWVAFGVYGNPGIPGILALVLSVTAGVLAGWVSSVLTRTVKRLEHVRDLRVPETLVGAMVEVQVPVRPAPHGGRVCANVGGARVILDATTSDASVLGIGERVRVVSVENNGNAVVVTASETRE